MMRRLLAALVFAMTASLAVAEDPPSPEECLVQKSGAPAVEVPYGDKTYRLANDACRAEFLTDPERYAQLYDALAELAAEGKPLAAPRSASLVPS